MSERRNPAGLRQVGRGMMLVALALAVIALALGATWTGFGLGFCAAYCEFAIWCSHDLERRGIDQ